MHRLFLLRSSGSKHIFYLLPNISSSFAVRDKTYSICLNILHYTYMVFAGWVPGCAGIFQVWETEGFVGNKLCSLGGPVECTFYHT